MKRKRFLPKSLMAMTVIMAMYLITGCKEKEIQETALPDAAVKIENYDKLVDFLSWSLQLPQDSIKFDQQTKEFYVPNTVVKEKLETVQAEYNGANIYKLDVEGK